MLIPYNTDAPLYHGPFATIGLIVVNVFVFFACVNAAMQHERDVDEEEAVAILSDPFAEAVSPWDEIVDPWCLWYGRGLHPVQWVTSNFMHADFLHLLGNMFGLWGLGLIVEGKVGWWKFLLIFLGIGVAQCAFEQTIMLWAPAGASLGASAIVFGLVAIALFWAPKNELSCVVLLGYGWLVQVSVLIYAGILLTIELVMFTLSGFSFGSAVLHFMGAVVGAGVGFVMLRYDLVDCEDWDLLSVMRGAHENPALRKRKKRRPSAASPEGEAEAVAEQSAEQQAEQQAAMALAQIRQLIDEGQWRMALAAHRRMGQELPAWRLPPREHLKLVAVLHAESQWAESIPLMVEYLHTHAQQSAKMRLQLARVLIEHERRPVQAMRVMEKIPAAELDEKLLRLRDKLMRIARKMHEEGEIEPPSEDW